MDVLGQGEIPFGERLLFHCQDDYRFTFFVEICEDLWVPVAPSSSAALAGATVHPTSRLERTSTATV